MLESAEPRLVIGLLGGIASGKSHVAKVLGSLIPATILDADKVAHEALAACARDGRLAETLGPEFVTEDGQADRAAIAAAVFQDRTRLRRLERLVHPIVLASIRAAIHNHRRGAGAPVLVLDAPLLIEVGLDRRCDVLWYVEVPEALRLERAARRGFTPEDLRLREQSQSPLRRKRARADRVIRNDVADEALEAQLREALDALGIRTTAAS